MARRLASRRHPRRAASAVIRTWVRYGTSFVASVRINGHYHYLLFGSHVLQMRRKPEGTLDRHRMSPIHREDAAHSARTAWIACFHAGILAAAEQPGCNSLHRGVIREAVRPAHSFGPGPDRRRS